jgi:hypothetical protein
MQQQLFLSRFNEVVQNIEAARRTGKKPAEDDVEFLRNAVITVSSVVSDLRDQKEFGIPT